MARLESSGIDELASVMYQEAATTGARAERVLKAGAEVVERAWRGAIQSNGLIKTAQMLNSVRQTSGPANAKGPAYALIFPAGTAKYPQKSGTRQVRNGLKAAVLNYGNRERSYSGPAHKNKKFPGRGIPETGWVADAEAAAEGPAIEAMRTAWAKEDD